ncbi:MAG TPA: M56 family metallopeptidase [Longimicrobium sp.]|nr:M56 family metallopeptidase [Longimicrobium sp.]
MIVYWMLYSVMVGVLLSGCAAALEKALRQLGRPTRWAWAAALLLTLAIPAAVHEFGPRPTAPAALPAEMPGVAAAVDVAPPTAPPVATPAPAPSEATAWLDALDPDALRLELRMFWLLSSVATLLLLAVMKSILDRRRHQWAPAEVDGVPVLVSDEAGPAVVGLLRQRIVLPRWVLDTDRAARALMLEHEQEHVRAGDPYLLAGAVAAVVLMPWNPAVWWQLRRLRLAMEVDCDARVLRRRGDVRAYGQVLLEVGRRGSGACLPGSIAIAEPGSALERRIRIMTAPRARRPLLRAAAFATVVLALTAATWQAPVPVPPPGGYLEVRPGTLARTGERITPRAMLERHYPQVLREGMGPDAMAVFVVSHGGEVLHHKLIQSVGNGAALHRELRRFQGQINARSSYFGTSPEFGPTQARIEIARLRPTPAEVVDLETLSGRMERRSYLRAVRRHYPTELRQAGVTGQVAVRLRVELYRKPQVLEIVRGDPRFFDAARAVVDDLYLSGKGENFMVISFPAERVAVAGRAF